MSSAIPENQTSSNNKHDTRRPPDVYLDLEWVFGYNGCSSKNNIKINSDGNLVYYVASVGIVYDRQSGTQLYFRGHTDAITCLAMNYCGTVVASGQVGMDPFIAIWDAIDCQPLGIINDPHLFQVTTLSFSKDYKFVASTGGSQHKLELSMWNWKKGRKVASTQVGSSKIEEIEFDPSDSSKLVTCGPSHFRFWKRHGNILQSKIGIFGQVKKDDQASISFMPNGTLVSGSANGLLLCWSSERIVKVIKGAHKGGVSTIGSFENGIISSGNDGRVTVYNENFQKSCSVEVPNDLTHDRVQLVKSLSIMGQKVAIGTEQNEIWIFDFVDNNLTKPRSVVQAHNHGVVCGLTVHPSKPLAITSSLDRTVRMWSLEDHQHLKTKVIEFEPTTVSYHPSGIEVAVGLRNGIILILAGNTLKEERKLQQSSEDAILQICYSPNGLLLAVSSQHGKIAIYSTSEEYSYKVNTSIGDAALTHIDWDVSSNFLHLNGENGDEMFYNVAEKLLPDLQTTESIEWASWNCIIGENVNGIWSKYGDVEDVNSADVNKTFKVLATGDDFGLVKLYRFPCTKRGSKARSFTGHCDHVTKVKWSVHNQQLVSTGGSDQSVFVWRLKEILSDNYFQVETPLAVGNKSKRLVKFASNEEFIDTEDELEALEEISDDVEDEIDTLKNSHRFQKSILSQNISSEGRSKSAFLERCSSEGNNGVDVKPPSYGLEVEHVFGYRSFDCRDNAHWLRDELLVYHVSAIAIVLNSQTLKQKHYLHHTDDIMCLAVHPNRIIVATGQVGHNAPIHIWDSGSMKILSILQGGSEEGIICLAFNHDGNLLSSIGMEDRHTISVWSWIKGKKIAQTRGPQNKVFGMRFRWMSSSSLVVYGVKHIGIWSIIGAGMMCRQLKLKSNRRSDTLLCGEVFQEDNTECWVFGLSSGVIVTMLHGETSKETKAHKGPVYSLLWTGEFGWTGGNDGRLCQWDRGFSDCLKIFSLVDENVKESCELSLKSSHAAIKSFSWGSGEILLIGTDKAELITMDNEGKFDIIVQGHCRGELRGLAVHPISMEAVTVSGDETLRRYSLEDYSSIASTNLRKPSVCVSFHPSGSMLCIGFLDGSISILTYPFLHRIGGVKHRKNSILDVKYSPDGRLLAVGCMEGLIDIYVVDTDGDIFTKESIGNGEQLIFEAPHGNQIELDKFKQKSLQWNTPITCPLDISLEGIWGPNADITDVNVVATANKLPLVVSACNKFGLIQLFNYPIQGSLKPHRKFTGHSKSVTNVCWSQDDTLVLSCGGDDTCLIVWKVIEKPISDDSEYQTVIVEKEITGKLLKIDNIGKKHLGPLVHVKCQNSMISQQLKHEDKEITKNWKTSSHCVLIEQSALFYADKSSVVKVQITTDYATTVPKVIHNDHETQITAMASSITHPLMIASASERKREDDGPDVHVWSPLHGNIVTVLVPDDIHDRVTKISFSANGRVLAVIYDDTNICIYNWVKGTKIASKDLLGKYISNILFTSDTSIAVLTPKELLICDLIGNSLIVTRNVTTRGLMIPEDISFTDLCVNEDGSLYAVCGDGSLISMVSGCIKLITIDRQKKSSHCPIIREKKISSVDSVINPSRLQNIVSDTPEIHSPVLTVMGKLIMCCFTDQYEVIIRMYERDGNSLKFTSEFSRKVPNDDFIPYSIVSSGYYALISSKIDLPFLLFDSENSRFVKIKPHL